MSKPLAKKPAKPKKADTPVAAPSPVRPPKDVPVERARVVEEAAPTEAGVPPPEAVVQTRVDVEDVRDAPADAEPPERVVDATVEPLEPGARELHSDRGAPGMDVHAGSGSDMVTEVTTPAESEVGASGATVVEAKLPPDAPTIAPELTETPATAIETLATPARTMPVTPAPEPEPVSRLDRAPEPRQVASDEVAPAPVARSDPAPLPQAPQQDEPIAEEPVAPAPSPPPSIAPLPQPPLLFEVAWEVCWQLGGIYTVLRSKAACMLERWDNRYCLIGPYNPHTAAVEFEEQPTEGLIRETLDRLRGQGIPCHYGRWLVPGRPRVILLDYRSRYPRLHEDKYLLWKDHGISTAADDGEVNDVAAFGFTVTEFFRELTHVAKGRTVVAHFHEWMGGVAVPRIAHLRIPVTTVFTTHATLLGRYLASDSANFYDHLPFINPDEQAAKYTIWPKFAIERAAAHASVVFTTVSEVTAFEAEKLLGRRPDLILPNGLNAQKFQAIHEFQNLHRQYKERIHEFVTGHFFPSYTFDLDKTLYVFTSGRYEYRNKGMDVYLEALHRLNWQLKEIPSGERPTIVAFVITRAATRNINVGVLQNQSMFEDLRNTCDEISNQIGERLFRSAATGRIPSYAELLPDDAQVRLKRAVHAMRSNRQPTIVTHDLMDDAGDPILRHLRYRGMFNAADDPVKVIFHPEFVTATSPLIHLDYEQFVRGCHMGIFPSYYEPWGYTPMESIALGVPAVTTDLSGFGAYVERHIEKAEEQGVLVLKRRYQSFDRAADDLVNHLLGFCHLTRRQRVEQRNKVERLSEMFDWSNLVRHYDEAHDLAMERVGAPKPGRFELRMV
jgi:glycogen synthase